MKVIELPGAKVQQEDKKGEIVSVSQTHGCPVEVGVRWQDNTYSVVPLYTLLPDQQ